MRTRIENGFLITVNINDDCMNGCVLIDNELILYAGPEKSAPAFNADRVIDANGGIVAPGFIDTHTHIPMNLFRGYADDMPLMEWLTKKIWPAEDKLTENAVYWGSMLGIAELVKGGVTCFSDMYNFNDVIANAADDSGIRALIASAVIDINGGGEERLNRAKAFYDKAKGFRKVTAAIGPHAEYTVSPEMFEKIRDVAAMLDMRIHIHISETVSEHEDCIKRHGLTPIKLLNSLGLTELPLMAAHCVWVDESDMEIMSEKGVHVMSCPGSNLKLGSGIAPVAKMLSKNINVSCATDGAASNNNLSMMEEMALLALLQKGVNRDPTLIPASTAFRTATINGAKVLGMEDITGSLEAGKQADIIILNTNSLRYCPRTNLLNHLVYSGSDADVVFTMVGGDILYENGSLTFVDEEEIKRKVEECAAILLT